LEFFGFSVDQYTYLLGLLDTQLEKDTFNSYLEPIVANGTQYYKIKDTDTYYSGMVALLGDAAEFDGFLAWDTFVIGKSQGSGGKPEV